jgi:hypothetical protein
MKSVEDAQLLRIEQDCHSGGLIAIAGDWELCRRTKERLEKSGKYAVCQSLAIEKQKVKLQTLMMEAAGKPVVLLVADAEGFPKRTRAEIGTLFQLAGANHFTVVLFEDPQA